MGMYGLTFSLYRPEGPGGGRRSNPSVTLMVAPWNKAVKHVVKHYCTVGKLLNLLIERGWV